MRQFVLLIAVLSASAASCAGEVEVAEPPFDCLAEASTTTVAIDPPSLPSGDPSVLPPLDDHSRYEYGRARIRAIESYPVEDAEAWSLESGWMEVQVVDADNPIRKPSTAGFSSAVIGFCARDGIVLRAWTGGW